MCERMETKSNGEKQVEGCRGKTGPFCCVLFMFFLCVCKLRAKMFVHASPLWSCGGECCVALFFIVVAEMNTDKRPEDDGEHPDNVTVDIPLLRSAHQSREEGGDSHTRVYLPCAWEEGERGGIEAPGDKARAALRDPAAAAGIADSLRRKKELRLLTFNFLIRPPPVTYNGNDYKNERIAIMVRDHLRHYDIVCMQEVFGSLSTRRKRLVQSAGQKAGLVYSYHSPGSGLRSVVDGGCLVLSRYPIVESANVSFAPGINADWLARKGALYTRIQLRPDLCMHVFTTHLQADYETNLHHARGNGPNQRVRRTQMQTLAAFIRDKTLPFVYTNPSWPVVLMGDLNINSRSGPTDGHDGPEYLDAMEIISEAGFRVHDLLKESHNGEHPVTICDSVEMPGGVLCPTEPQLTPHNEFHQRRSIDYILLLTPNLDVLREPPSRLFAATEDVVCCGAVDACTRRTRHALRYRVVSCGRRLCRCFAAEDEEYEKLKDDKDLSPPPVPHPNDDDDSLDSSESDDEEEDDESQDSDSDSGSTQEREHLIPHGRKKQRKRKERHGVSSLKTFPVSTIHSRTMEEPTTTTTTTTTAAGMLTGIGGEGVVVPAAHAHPGQHVKMSGIVQVHSAAASSSATSTLSSSPPLPEATEKASIISAESKSALFRREPLRPASPEHSPPAAASSGATTTTTTTTTNGVLGAQPVLGIRHTLVEKFEVHNPDRPYHHLSDHYAVRSLWYF